MIQYLPMIANLAQTAFGAVKEGQQRKRMAGERQKWNAENEALYNKNYYGDYTKRADAQSAIRQMDDQMKKADKVEQNVAAVTGATPEAINASKERRNKAVTSLYSNIGANAMQYKDAAEGRYQARKAQLQGMEYDSMEQTAQSAGNVMNNGIAGLATDWAILMTKPTDYKSIERNAANDIYFKPRRIKATKTKERQNRFFFGSFFFSKKKEHVTPRHPSSLSRIISIISPYREIILP